MIHNILFEEYFMERKPKNFIKAAIKHPGALRKSLKIKQGEKIPEDKLDKATKSTNPILRKRAIFAKTLRGLRKTGGR